MTVYEQPQGEPPRRPAWRLVALVVLAVILVGGLAFALASAIRARGGSELAKAVLPSPSPSAHVVPSATPTPTFTATPTRTPTPTPTATLTPTPTPTPIVAITGINGLGRLETAQFMMQTIVNLQSPPGNLFEQLTGPDQLLLVAEGEVVAGFDMRKVKEGDVEVRGTSVHLYLPPPEILYSRVDNENTYVYERKTGLLRKPDPGLETQARRQAETQLVDWAMKRGILDRAREFGTTYMEGFLRSLGFTDIKIDVRSPRPEELEPTPEF